MKKMFTKITKKDNPEVMLKAWIDEDGMKNIHLRYSNVDDVKEIEELLSDDNPLTRNFMDIAGFVKEP